MSEMDDEARILSRLEKSSLGFQHDRFPVQVMLSDGRRFVAFILTAQSSS